MDPIIFDPSKPENLDEKEQLLTKGLLEKCMTYSMDTVLDAAGVEYFSQPEDKAKIFLLLSSEMTASS